MTDQNTGAERFSAGRALGFFIEVFRARPAGFIALCVLHVVGYTALSVLGSLAMAHYGIDYMQAVLGGEASQFGPAWARYMGASSAATLIGIVITLWVETVWLRFMVSGQARLLPRAGDLGRVLLAFIVFFGVFFAGGIAAGLVVAFAMFVGMALEQAFLAAVLGIAVMIAAGLAAIWLLVRLSPFAALSVLERRIALAETFTGTRAVFWPLLGAWFLFILIYLAVMVLMFVVLWLMPGAYSEALTAPFTAFGDPMAQFRAYEAAFETPHAVLVTVVSIAVTATLGLPVVLVGRSIAARAALDISAARKQAGPDRSQEEVSGEETAEQTDRDGHQE